MTTRNYFKNLPSTLVAVILGLAMTTTANANLISNGDFESNTGGDGGNATDWTKDGAFGIYDAPGNGNVPHTVFDSWAYVSGNGGSTSAGVYQTLGSSLVGGTEYTLSFQANAWNAGASLDVRVGKYNAGSRDSDASYSPLALAAIDNFPDDDFWFPISHTFTATGGEDTVYFGTALGLGADIDNVSLVANSTNSNSSTPEPSTLMLAAFGLIGLLSTRRLRRRRG